MGEASFYTEILAGMLAGAFGAEIFRWTPWLAALKNASVSILLKWIPALLVAICFILASTAGLSEIAAFEPMLDEYALQTASFVRESTDPEATYLFIGRINEAEWFPYLFDRTPVFGPWGSEWKGTYDQQSKILIALEDCETQESWACMDGIQQEQSAFPDLLVIRNKGWLIGQIKDTHFWDLIYKNRRYLVWKRIN
jgi:hypothetical protein